MGVKQWKFSSLLGRSLVAGSAVKSEVCKVIPTFATERNGGQYIHEPLGFYDHESLIFWKRPLRAWELEQVVELNKILQNIRLSVFQDKLIWSPGNDPYSVMDAVEWISKSKVELDVEWSFI